VAKATTALVWSGMDAARAPLAETGKKPMVAFRVAASVWAAMLDRRLVTWMAMAALPSRRALACSSKVPVFMSSLNRPSSIMVL
jgi:hypothetical protein